MVYDIYSRNLKKFLRALRNIENDNKCGITVYKINFETAIFDYYDGIKDEHKNDYTLLFNKIENPVNWVLYHNFYSLLDKYKFIKKLNNIKNKHKLNYNKIVEDAKLLAKVIEGTYEHFVETIIDMICKDIQDSLIPYYIKNKDKRYTQGVFIIHTKKPTNIGIENLRTFKSLSLALDIDGDYYDYNFKENYTLVERFYFDVDFLRTTHFYNLFENLAFIIDPGYLRIFFNTNNKEVSRMNIQEREYDSFNNFFEEFMYFNNLTSEIIYENFDILENRIYY